ncbi:hypothetical protein NE865_07369 [Phthorimaea operculella]|nr:hypothetical protein NE865_07369 [Phthorimaea operculella]
MITFIIQFAALWTVCTPVRHFNDYYYQPVNSSRTTPDGIAAYRSALTLDWMSAEDSRQRELAAAFEQGPQFPSPIAKSDCYNYHRPSAGSVAKLILEVMKNLEGEDDGYLIAHLVQALLRAKLLLLESTMFENEPDLDALVKTPSAMVGEPHTTFPRVVEVLWLAVTDPSSVKKHGWCTVNKMTAFLHANRPIDIARHMRASEQIISRVRFIMEEFIQHVTPLNIEKVDTRFTAATPKVIIIIVTIPGVTERFKTPTLLPKSLHFLDADIDNQNKRPVRMHALEKSEKSFRRMPAQTRTVSVMSITEDTDDQEALIEAEVIGTTYTPLMDVEKIIPLREGNHVQMSTSKKNPQIAQWLFILMMCLLL